jgi:hypothetical protein
MASPAADKEEAETEKANNTEYIKKSTGWDGFFTNHCCFITFEENSVNSAD